MTNRTEELEIKVAYLEKSLVELDDVVREMADKIQALEREVAEIRDESMPSGNDLESEKPPHY